MARVSKVRAWARDVGIADRGVARLMDVSRWTVISWRRNDPGAPEPHDWRERLLKGLEREMNKLRD